MGTQLDLDDLVSDWPEAKAELARLRAERDELRAALKDINDIGKRFIQNEVALRLSRIAHAALSRTEGGEVGG